MLLSILRHRDYNIFSVRIRRNVRAAYDDGVSAVSAQIRHGSRRSCLRESHRNFRLGFRQSYLLCPKDVQLGVYMAGLIFFGLGMGFYNCVSWAMMGDAIDYSEWKTGKREEGVVFALHSFFRKLAQGVGPAAVIAIMGTSLIGYESALGTIGQSPETAARLCWLVAGLYLLSAVCQFVGIGVIYNIDKKTLAKMNEELAARHASAPSEEVVPVTAE